MNRKYAVITINIGKHFSEIGDLTTPFMKKYADKIGTDFVIIQKIKQQHVSKYSAYWAKFQLYDLLAEYERILFLDLDTLIYPHCPNLFDLVPPDHFAALMETDYGIDQTEEILDIQARVMDIGWRKDYFNVGVMVASTAHKEVFNLRHGSDGGQKYPEQTQINYNVQRFKIPVFRLDYRFNHTFFWHVNNNLRENSFITHYAAIPHKLRFSLIKEDTRRYYAGEHPLPENEIHLFLNTHFPGEDLETIMKTYHLLTDSEIGLLQKTLSSDHRAGAAQQIINSSEKPT